MSWDVTFADGPLVGPEHDRTFMGYLPYEIWLIPMLDHGDEWVVIATDGDVPDPPWEGQVHYIRRAGSETVFEQAPDPSPVLDDPDFERLRQHWKRRKA